jgi:hypothetical protein
MAGDPHEEYRRQAAAHFGLGRTERPAGGRGANQPPDLRPPRIFRNTDDAPTQAFQSAPPSGAAGPAPQVNRFPAGTTYGGGAGSRRTQVPPAPRMPAPPSPPVSHRPPPPATEPDTDSIPIVPQGYSAAFALQPYHVLRVACGLAVIASIVASSMFGWFVIAVACAAGECYTRTHRVRWPADVQDVLHRARMAPEPTDDPRTTPATEIIPFRPLTIPDIFLGAFRVVARNWPTLIGIPAVILIGFVVFLGVALYLLVTVFSDVFAPLFGGLFTASMESGSLAVLTVVVMVCYFLFTAALALPADALLISTSVIATDMAVRGGRVRLAEVFRASRMRMFAVCRLTLVFYGISFMPDIVLTFALFTLGISALLPVMVICFIGMFIVGILFSLSPIVLVVENRGVADSLRRSMQLAKPAFGRLLAIHALWAVGATALLMMSWVPVFIFGDLAVLLAVPYLIGLPVMVSYFRTVQMLIYTDLRIRQESYERELLADWTRNTQLAA